jgi:hypothetical protein
MTRYSEIEGGDAEWVQPKTMKRRFELRQNDALVGSLFFRSVTGTLAVAESAHGCWTYKRVGFFNTRITIRKEGVDTDLAVYKPNLWGYGILKFNDGSSYAWRATNIWRTAWVLTGAGDRPIIQFRAGVEGQKLGDTFKTQATVAIDPSAPDDKRLPILLSFGMYMLKAHEDDETAAIAVIIAS